MDGRFSEIDIPLDSAKAFAASWHKIDTAGPYTFDFGFYDAHGNLVAEHYADYTVVETGVRSTRHIDGCWISIVHWSEEESRHFNTDLKKLTDKDWKDQIAAMGAVGIKTVLIQNLYESNAYAGNHEMTPESYNGTALYPSKRYPRREGMTSEDPLEAILKAADENDMTVFVGVGLFAWFDFGPASLEWHKQRTRDLFETYGHHKSLYGWYISEEMFGSLYEEWEHVPAEEYTNIVTFFREYRAMIRELTPTKPIALAPNNIRFHEFPEEWSAILANLDVLIPFAFARDPENLNIRQIQAICDRTDTHFWVDMEMFAYPFDEGLKPKGIEELKREIGTYDDIENIFGYQFTGIMNPPESGFNLGGEAAKQLYTDYRSHVSGELSRLQESKSVLVDG